MCVRTCDTPVNYKIHQQWIRKSETLFLNNEMHTVRKERRGISICQLIHSLANHKPTPPDSARLQTIEDVALFTPRYPAASPSYRFSTALLISTP